MKYLRRSETNKVIAGVCGGIAEYTGIDPTIVRVFYILVTAFTGFIPGIVAYAALAFIMPNEQEIISKKSEVTRAKEEHEA